MTWIVLLALLAVEFFVAMLLVKLIAWPRRGWMRWLAFVFLLLVVAGPVCLGFWVAWDLHQWKFRDWMAVFAPNSPFPTLRLFVLTTIPAIPAYFLVLGIVGLRRAKPDEPQARAANWLTRRVFLGLGVACGILLLAFLINDWLICRRIKDLQTQASRLAQQVTPPKPKDADNAALLYMASMPDGQALPRYRGTEYSHNYEALRDASWTDYLAAHRELAEEIRLATRRSECQFDLAWPQASIRHDETNHVGHVMNCVRLLLAEGHVALLDGNANRGYENAIALRAIADHLSRDPRSVTKLVAYASNGCATYLIEHALNVRAPSSEELARLQSSQFEFRERLPEAFTWTQAELYDGMWEMYVERRLEDEPLDPPPGYAQVLAANLALSRLLFAQDDMYALPIHLEKFRAHARLSYADGIGLWDSPKARIPPDGLGLIEYGGIITTRMMNMERVVIDACCRTDASRRVADSALELVAKHGLDSIATGELDVGTIAANLPLDPFTAQPLKVVAADGGIVIYSVGMNRRDDGGRPRKRERFFDDDDEAVCLGTPFQLRRLTPPAEDTTTE